jgi:hypothetical protein
MQCHAVMGTTLAVRATLALAHGSAPAWPKGQPGV